MFSNNMNFSESNELERFKKKMEKSVEDQVLKKYFLLGTYYITKSSTSIKSLEKSVSMFYDVIVPLEIDLLNKGHVAQNYSNFTNSKTNENGSVTLELSLTELEELNVLYKLVLKLQSRVKHLSKLN